MRAARVLCVLPAVLLLSAPFVKAQSANDPPTLFERWQERREKCPALEQKLLTAVDVMKKAAWMEGRWEVTEKVYKAGRIPELVAKGTRESRLDLDGRCLVSRQTVGSLKTIDALIHDPYQGYWFQQIMTNGGRGALQPLVATSSWENGGLVFSGTLWAFGEKADVRVRIQKDSDALFDAVEGGRLKVSEALAETAKPTRRIAASVLWIFALIMAYPYLPGSGTEAFKGVSVVLGVMISLGSTTIVGQLFSRETSVQAGARGQ